LYYIEYQWNRTWQFKTGCWYTFYE